MNITAVFLILTFYSVIAGWGLAYIPKLATGIFQGASPAEVQTEFEGLLGSVDLLMFWHALFMGITIYIVGRGVQRGIERAVKILMPLTAAVGLGNLWKFPYTAGVSGGSAFVLIYVVAIAAIAIPIVMAELLIGRRGRMSPPNSMRKLSEMAGAGSKWRFVGWMNITAVFLILTFYSVIAGWGLAYIPKLATGIFQGASPAEVQTEFEGLLGSVDLLMFWHALFMGITIYIVGRGVQRGIERAVKILMPLLFLLLLILLGYAMVVGDFAAAWSFLFDFDFSKITAGVVLAAVGQAFFSVSVAMGLLMIYGAYLPANVSIPRAAAIIATADTLVAILAGLVIQPAPAASGGSSAG